MHMVRAHLFFYYPYLLPIAQRSLNIFPIPFLCSPENIVRLYFGADTIGYLQFHVVCVKLFTSFIVMTSLCFFRAVARPQGLFYTKRSFLSFSSLKLFRSTDMVGGCFQNKKPPKRIYRFGGCFWDNIPLLSFAFTA